MLTKIASVAVCVVLAALTACESNVPGPLPSVASTTAQSADPDSVVIGPGKVGPFVIGTSSSDLLAAGVVQEPPAGACPTLVAAGEYKDFGLQFDNSKPDKPLAGVLIKVRGPRTAEGFEVGDRLKGLKQAYGSKLKEHTGTYGELVYSITDGEAAIGFGVEDDKVSSIEVFAAGDLPIWDGC